LWSTVLVTGRSKFVSMVIYLDSRLDLIVEYVPVIQSNQNSLMSIYNKDTSYKRQNNLTCWY